MGEPILQLLDPANWELAWDDTISATLLGNGAWLPHNAFVVPVLLDSPFVALSGSSSTASQSWKLAYWVRQYISPAPVGTGFFEGTTRKAYLNRTIIARFPMIAQSYQLRLQIPYWHRTMQVGIWAYTGTVDDSTEALIREQSDLIRVDLLRIENKVNQLL